MDLKDLIFLGACSVLGGNVAATTGPGTSQNFEDIDNRDVREAVELAKRVWAATVADKDI